MKIIAATIDWNLDYANDPDIRIILDFRHEFIYDRIPSPNGVYYFSEHEGVATFHYSNSDKSGYGGRTFDLPMSDGSVAHVKGPWHVGPSWLNSQRPDHLELIPVYHTYNAEVGSYFGICVTLEKLQKEALPFLPNIALARISLNKHNYVVPILLNKDHDCISDNKFQDKGYCKICKHKMYSNIVLL